MRPHGDHGTRLSPPARPWVIAAFVVAVVAAAAVVGLRLANAGAEPEGQNWWLVAHLVVGLAYLPAGAALATQSERRLIGILFLVVGTTALLTALSTQYLAYATEEGEPVASATLASFEAWKWLLGGSVLATVTLLSLLPAAWRADRRLQATMTIAWAGIAMLVLGQVTTPWPAVLGANPLEASRGWPAR